SDFVGKVKRLRIKKGCRVTNPASLPRKGRAMSLASRTKILAILASALALTGCSKTPPIKDTPPVEVVVSQPVKEKVADWDTFTGTVAPVESVEVRSGVRGHIKEVTSKDGDEIPADKELFVIDSDPFKADLKSAEGALETWKAKLKLAEEKIAIYEPLVKK